ncbi:MAG: hypothetical protein MI924_00830 [Chloroflexales bacterium]|nr:hypothetical protein [Chloroflexales bacterium]
MATRLIRLEDGALVEVEAKPNDVQQISSDTAKRVQESIERVKPILVNVCRPVVAAWNELSQEMDIEGAEVELGLSFEAEGGIYIVRGTATANLVVKLTLKPKASSSAE